jgi:hypothetical protein
LFRLSRVQTFTGKGLKFGALTVGVSGGWSVRVYRTGTSAADFFSGGLTF